VRRAAEAPSDRTHRIRVDRQASPAIFGLVYGVSAAASVTGLVILARFGIDWLF
jgi:hypothetical protein